MNTGTPKIWPRYRLAETVRREKLFLLDGGEVAIERQRPAGRCKLGRPDRVHKENIEPRVAVFEFLREQIVNLRRRLRRDLANHFDSRDLPARNPLWLGPKLERLPVSR